jgi:2-dehydropantoate 2-reductase
MKIGIVGIGALGCLLGAYLDEVADVVLIGHWPAQVAAIGAAGLWLERPDGRRTHHTPPITAIPAAVGPLDVTLIAVKSRQTGDAARTAARLLDGEGLAVTLQNGLNNRATLRRVLGDGRATLGVTSHGATLLGVGQVRHAGVGPTHFGLDPLLGPAQQEKLSSLVLLFNEASFESHLVANTDGLVWGKLAVNAAINPLTALLRVPNGFLVEDEALIAVMRRVAGEVVAVAEAQGIALPFPDAVERPLIVAQATAANRSSMLQDVDRGAPTEIDAICGAVARIGRELGVATPLNIRLCRLVRQVEEGRPPLDQPGDVAGLIKLLEDFDR